MTQTYVIADVHGHTPHGEPELLADRTNLDTGACFGGCLSVGVFDDDTPVGPVQVIKIKGEW
jgi:serine/threonine protein phosphatase 1